MLFFICDSIVYDNGTIANCLSNCIGIAGRENFGKMSISGDTVTTHWHDQIKSNAVSIKWFVLIFYKFCF